MKLRLERDEEGRSNAPRPLRDLVGEEEDFLGEVRGDKGRDEVESLRLCLGGDLAPSLASSGVFFDFLSGDLEKSLGSTIWTESMAVCRTKIFRVSYRTVGF